jgi:hydrogenase maturation protease
MKDTGPGIEAASEAFEPGVHWLVAGVGTPAAGDDEIGLALVRALSRDPERAARCRLLECADAAMVATALLEWRQPVLLVDAADMGLAPGSYRLFPESHASLALKTSSVSTHGLSLADGLELARILGFDLPVHIFGVQPFDVSPRRGMTPELTALFPRLLEALKDACVRLSRLKTPGEMQGRSASELM